MARRNVPVRHTVAIDRVLQLIVLQYVECANDCWAPFQLSVWPELPGLNVHFIVLQVLKLKNEHSTNQYFESLTITYHRYI